MPALGQSRTTQLTPEGYAEASKADSSPYSEGDLVIICGHLRKLERTLGPGIPGEWRIDEPIYGLSHWNEDEMRPAASVDAENIIDEASNAQR